MARRILDVGAGTGALLDELKAAAPEATVIGIDRSEGMLRVARKAGHQHLLVADAQRLGLGSSTMDVAVLIFVLFHLPDPSLGLREIHRVLRVGGTVGVVTWGPRLENPGMSIWQEELDRAGADADPRDPSVMQQATMDTAEKLQHLLRIAGFEAVNLWSAKVTHQWMPDDLLAMQISCGMPARRLSSLSNERRKRCRARVRTLLRKLTPAELEFRGEVLFAVAERPRQPS
ncbi:hypothetical protein AYO41_00610 [Verrucomicrobia bacterium SCGC AG-212-E04]|nr:hypothetical protein AYO41_00610 [Verrucomicrobia bacterium SCGC AG-212-E04]